MSAEGLGASSVNGSVAAPPRGASLPLAPGTRRARRAGRGDLNLVGRARREPPRGRAVHGSAPSLPSLRPSESGARSPASCATPCASRAERHETSVRASGAATTSVWPTGHPRAACGWGRGARGERCSTAPGHTRGAAAEPMAPRGAWWARGGRPCGRRASWRYVWHEVPINGRIINGPSAADQSTRLSIMGCYN